MKRWWVTIALLLSLGVNVGILATLGVLRLRATQPPPAPTAAVSPARLEAFADHLRLTGERRQTFLAIQRRFVETLVRERRQLERLRGELKREVGARSPDRERIDALMARLGPHYAALDRAFIDNVLASRELLDRREERRYFTVLRRMRANLSAADGRR